MESLTNTFKKALLAGQQQIGIWSNLANYSTVEVMAGSGFDWILLDTEHSPNELPLVHTQLMAMKGGTAHPIVRPSWNGAVQIKRLLDIGVQTLLIPFVQTEEEARQAVAATRYPPQGIRGFAAAARASHFGRVKNYFSTCADDLCVLVQIETRTALDNLEAIANVEGVDGVFIGPGDLSASLGFLGNPGHPTVEAAVIGAIRRIRAAGKAAGVLTGDEALARRYIDAGGTFTAVGSDIGILAKGTEQLASRFKNAS